MNVGNSQLELIAKVKKYLAEKLNEKINVHSSGVCYFCSPGLTPGYVKLKLWNEGLKSLLTTYKILLKDIKPSINSRIIINIIIYIMLV